MARPRRRTVLIAAVALAVAVVATALVVLLRGPGADDVAEDYLAATWEGDWRTECDLATEQWRHYLFEGHPFADCGEYADAAAKANKDGGFSEFADDTDIAITTETISSGDGRARVAYVIEFTYDGDDRAGFDELWQGGGAVDRGTVELVQDDGDWRIAGVDAG